MENAMENLPNSSPSLSDSPNPASPPTPSSTPPLPGSPSSPQPTSPLESAQVHEPSEVPALRRTHVTDGYRAGISAGKGDTVTVQKGFDAGFPIGAALGLRIGFLRGAVERFAVGMDEGKATDLKAKMEAELSLEGLLADEGVRRSLRQSADLADSEDEAGRRKRLDDCITKLDTIKKWTGITHALGVENGIDLRYGGQ